MVDIKRFVLHLVRTKEDNPAGIVKSKEIKIKPSNNENTLRMKEDVATVLVRERVKDWSYWYLVMEIDGPDGKPRFRTVVGKTFF